MSIWNNDEIYRRLTTSSGRRIGRRRAIETIFHVILLVRVLVSLHGILGIMNQYKDYDDNNQAMHDIEQLMDMPNHHHLPLLLEVQQQQQKAAKNDKLEEIDIMFPFAAAESVNQAARLRRQRQVSCGEAHFASSCAECPRGSGNAALWCNGQCVWNSHENECVMKKMPSFVHKDYYKLLEEYPFQPVTNENGIFVNVILVRASPLLTARQRDLFLKYKDEILFLGITSHETIPLSSSSSPNHLYSSLANFSNDDYRSLFPGFLTMMRHPEEYFDPSVKTILMSPSDFNLDRALAYYHRHHHGSSSSSSKMYDFILLGSDQDDVDNNCGGWTFVVQTLEVMCNDSLFNLTGVSGPKACRIPDACAGKIVQTSLLDQDDFFHYLSLSKFAFVPQVHDASPRVVTQALAMNVPVLMNDDNIVGGWKHLNDKTGEFFHGDDLSNFQHALQTLLLGIDESSAAGNNKYGPRKYIMEHFYGNEHAAGVKLKDFVMSNWGGRVVLPDGTMWLIPSGA